MSELSPTARVVLEVLADRRAHGIGHITIRDLAAALGTDVVRRDIEEAIGELRDAGEPVVTSTHGQDRGVWLSTDPAEVRACARALGRRIASQYLRVRALRKTAEVLEQPMVLFPEREFLPYAVLRDDRTLGELVEAGGLPMLTAGASR